MIVVLLVGLNIPFLHIQMIAALIPPPETYAEFVEKRKSIILPSTTYQVYYLLLLIITNLISN